MSATTGSAHLRRALTSGALVTLATIVACEKGAPSGAPSLSASVAAVSSSPPAPPVASAPSAAGMAKTAWAGAYTAKVGAVDPPKNAKEKTWVDDPGTVAVGKGTIELSISAPRGDVTGEVKGPLGELNVAGTFDGHELRASLTPKNPKGDPAMTGFMMLTGDDPSAASLTGNLRVSGRDARLVREASIQIAKK